MPDIEGWGQEDAQQKVGEQIADMQLGAEGGIDQDTGSAVRDREGSADVLEAGELTILDRIVRRTREMRFNNYRRHGDEIV